MHEIYDGFFFPNYQGQNSQHSSECSSFFLNLESMGCTYLFPDNKISNKPVKLCQTTNFKTSPNLKHLQKKTK